MNNNEPQLAILREAVEKSIGKKIKTPKDFDILRGHIYARVGVLMSATTLKRVWNYVDGGTPRITTLDTLSRFAGFANWDDFKAKHGKGQPQSNLVMSKRISVTEDLRKGDCLLLTWLPDRKCTIRYEGNMSFSVLSSENTRLQSGDRFECSLFIEGEPLYLDNLVMKGTPNRSSAYVCGRKDGIRFEKING